MIIGSVFKSILNSAEIGDHNSFSMSVTIVVLAELYHNIKRYRYFGKYFYRWIKKSVGDGYETGFHDDIDVKS